MQTEDIFNYYDGVIHQHTDTERKSRHGNDIQRDIGEVHQHDGEDDRKRDRTGNDECRSEISEEDQQHQDRKSRTHQHVHQDGLHDDVDIDTLIHQCREMHLLCLILLQTPELCQDQIRHIAGGISCLLLKAEEHARFSVDLRIGRVRIALDLHIRDIRKIYLTDTVHAEIDQYQILKILHGLDGFADLDQELTVLLGDISCRHIKVLCHQQLTDHVSRKYGINVRLGLGIRLGLVNGLLCGFQCSRTCDQLCGRITDLKRPQDLIFAEGRQCLIDGCLSGFHLFLRLLNGSDPHCHLSLALFQCFDGRREIIYGLYVQTILRK